MGTTSEVFLRAILDQLIYIAKNGSGGGGGVTTIGTIDTGSASANGGSISGSTFYFQSASDTVPGLMNTLDQVFTGNKTFNTSVILAGKTAGSNIFLDGSLRLSEDNGNWFYDSSSKIVYVGANSGAYTNTKIHAQANVNSYSQINSVNKNAGASASGDYVITADTGTDSINYIDMFMNSSTYSDASYTISGALDGGMYVNGGNLILGTQTAAKTIKFHTGGTLAANLRMTIADTTMTLAGLGTTNTFTGQTSNTAFNGYSLVNSTAATSGNQQYSPFTVHQGQGFGSTGSVNRSVAVRQYMVPIQGTTNPTGNFVMDFSVNGAAAVNPIYFTTNGDIGINNATPGSAGFTKAFAISARASNGQNVILDLEGRNSTIGGGTVAIRASNNGSRQAEIDFLRGATNDGYGRISLVTAANTVFNQAMLIDENQRVYLTTGSTIASSTFHIKASNGGLNTAPFQVDVGTSETTPRSGIVQFSSSSASGIQAINGSRWTLVESDLGERYIVQAVTSAKVTAGAPFTNDGYVLMTINGTTAKFMTIA